ncbi:MAG: long-chain fatty acid--CoA ligase [Ramlibacter sp.]|nr:long-chain fatty acid--CoA ligase [Ramlibacter sp.]
MSAAIVDGGVRISIDEIEAQADRLARAMLKRGVPRGALIGVRVRPRCEWFVLNRAIARIGGVHLALNWRLLPSELGELISGSDLSALVLDDPDPTSVLAAIPASRFSCLVHFGREGEFPGTSFASLVAEAGAASKGPLPHGGTAPLMFFTSGTTGRPKAVARAVEHDGARAQALREYQFDVVRRRYGLVRDRRELLTLPLHHGMGPMAADVCLKQGGTLHILRQFEPLAALRILSEQRITSWSCVPTMLYRIAALPAAELERHRPTDLAALNVGAAYFSTALKEWAIRYFGPCVSEGYGLTETGPVSGISGAQALLRPQSCGKPYRHVRLRIVDESGCECVAGQPGELLVTTPLLAHNGGAGGYFRTGDIAWLDDEGFSTSLAGARTSSSPAA